jgi:hypothetical protein
MLARRGEQLYNAYGANEGWGIYSIQHMLTAPGENPGPVTGSMNPATKQAVESFQDKNGLTKYGSLGPKTRAKLFAAYMSFLWPRKMEKGDFQGCSEFNPVRVFLN